MQGAPSIALDSGASHVPGSAKCCLGQLATTTSQALTPTQRESDGPSPEKPKLTESVKMLAQSSKLGEALERAATPSMFEAIDLATPSPEQKKKTAKEATPAKANSASSPSLDLVTPESKSVTSASRKTTPKPSKARSPPLARQLFAPSRKPTPSQASQAPKPEGYWKFLAQKTSIVCCMLPIEVLPRVLQIHKPRVWRYCKPNSKGEVKATPQILELGKTSDGRTSFHVRSDSITFLGAVHTTT